MVGIYALEFTHFSKGQLMSDLDWLDEATCVDRDPEIFFTPSFEKDAKKICKTCPVAKQCLLMALEKEFEYGVWGGLTEKERKLLKKPKARFRK